MRFVESEYRVGTLRAPALQCARCKAIELDESAADAQSERELVYLALAARAAVCRALASARPGPPLLPFSRLDERTVRCLLGPEADEIARCRTAPKRE